MITDYMNPKMIQLHVRAYSWQQAVETAARPLMDMHHIDHAYIERMVAEYDPYIVLMEGVAVAHARPGADVLSSGISLAVFDEPIVFGHPRYDPVRLIFVLAFLDDKEHILGLMDVAQKLRRESLVEELRRCTEVQEAWQLLTL